MSVIQEFPVTAVGTFVHRLLLTLGGAVAIVRPALALRRMYWTRAKMTRRAWVVILGATACLFPLSGCAQSTQNLLRSKQEDPAPRTQVDPGHGGMEEQFSPPPRPGSQELPPGRRVPEYLQPPPVLPPLRVVCPTPQASSIAKTDTPPVQCDKPVADHDLVSALRMLLDKQPDKALAYLERYDRATQEMFIRLLPTLVLLEDKSIEQLSPAEVGTLQDQMQGVLVTLRGRTALTINKLLLCDQFKGFGQVKVKRDYVFQAGDMMQVYVELCNTDCERRDDYYVTVVHGTVAIIDTNGTTVCFWNYKAAEAPLQSCLPRYDCCRNYVVWLPGKMPPGRYFLTIEMADETRPTRRVTQKSVEFVVR
jgi:hypothetical protein